MKQILTDDQIANIIGEADNIAKADYKEPEPTARQHAKLQSLQIKVNAELIKTIRHLDEKNGKLQKLLFWLSVVATVATVVALLK
jgi:hypothetical protein